MNKHRVLNTPAIRRMPTYLHKLMLMYNQHEEYVSTSVLAKYMSIDSIVVRKDLELTGITGYRGVGYKVGELIEAIRSYLGWDKWTRACLVGAGSLGSALLGFQEFSEYGLNICEVFDISPKRIGTEIYGHLVKDARDMAAQIRKNRLEMAILCIPGSCSQKVAEELVDCGIKLFWNFANTCLKLPADVIVQREVIAGGFALLSRKRMEHHGKGNDMGDEE